jgi:hypothetical protein
MEENIQDIWIFWDDWDFLSNIPVSIALVHNS